MSCPAMRAALAATTTSWRAKRAALTVAATNPAPCACGDGDCSTAFARRCAASRGRGALGC
eukprot:5905423-Pleurochrysis_carterae.AAC.1